MFMDDATLPVSQVTDAEEASNHAATASLRKTWPLPCRRSEKKWAWGSTPSCRSQEAQIFGESEGSQWSVSVMLLQARSIPDDEVLQVLSLQVPLSGKTFWVWFRSSQFRFGWFCHTIWMNNNKFLFFVAWIWISESWQRSKLVKLDRVSEFDDVECRI